MSVALFVSAEGSEDSVADREVDRIADLVRACPGLRSGLIHRPVEAAPEHPFAADGSGPALVLELRFDTAPELEAVLRPEALGRLALPGARITHQAFAARDFPVADATFRAREPCTFLVQYPGPSSDPGAWLDHYDVNHPPIMCRFPGIRAVATYRPIDWRSNLAWARGAAMQRNKVVFDTPAALGVALASPVMAEMRADRGTFPPFEGGATHFPMRTTVVV